MRRALFLCTLLALAACREQPAYLGDGKIYQVALTDDTTPALEVEEEAALFIVETRAELPVRQPTSAELAALSGAGERAQPFPRLPWVERDDIPIQVDFTLTNLDDRPHNIDVIINGANEFFEYVPRVIMDEEQAIPLHSQWERRYDLKPKQRLAATVREEELDEMAVDLATVVNGAPNSDEVVYFENNSASDARSKPYIPKVIPGLIALRLGLRASAAANVLLEVSVRVRDVANKLAEDDEPQFEVTPQLFETVLPDNEN
jgi:hypothetical protein